jgi:hypothetical protein
VGRSQVTIEVQWQTIICHFVLCLLHESIKRGFASVSNLESKKTVLQTEALMMDQIFDWCVNVLIYWAGVFGITYKEINVWVFVIIWPLLTIILIGIIVRQRRRIYQLTGES